VRELWKLTLRIKSEGVLGADPEIKSELDA